MKTLRSRGGLALVLAACALAPSLGFSEVPCATRNRTKAVRLGKQAKDLLDHGSYDEALQRLRAAYALCPEPWVFHAMGRVQEAAGNLEDALASFRSCEREASDPGLQRECRSRAEAVETRLKPPAEPAPPTPAAPPPVAGPAVTAPASVALPPVAESAPPPAPVSATPSVVRRPDATWNWVGVGVSVALIGTGVGFLGHYAKERSDAHTSSWVDAQGYTHDPDRVKPTNAIVGGVAAGVGVAVLVTSLVLWPDAPAAVSVSPGLAGGTWVSLAARW